MEVDESMAVAVPGGSPMAASSSGSVDDQLDHQWRAANDAYTTEKVTMWRPIAKPVLARNGKHEKVLYFSERKEKQSKPYVA